MSQAGARIISHQTDVSSYEKLVRRINQVITSPRAQIERQAVLSPTLEEHPADWERLLDEIREAENVLMTRQEDGSVHVRWTCPEH